jgi:4-hydroxy-tetrahydrodipicolinate reductase
MIFPELVEELRDAGIRAVISLTERSPFPGGSPPGFSHLHLPVPDMTAPPTSVLETAVRFIDEQLRRGDPTVVHCGAGLGRTGTVLACYLVSQGASADEAMRDVREARPGSIETAEQEQAIRHFAGEGGNEPAPEGGPLRVLVNGAKGHMGRLATEVIRDAPDLILVGETDIDDDLVAEVRGSRAEVAIDFTHHRVAMDCFRAIVAGGACPVAGTSGFTPAHEAEAARLLHDAGRGGIIVPNFSIGAVLMMLFAREAARRFSHVEIVELHHDRKGDAPSGTAERTAALIAGARREIPGPRVEETERYPGARGGLVAGVPVHSIRLPGLLAHQEVLFSSAGELLTIRHDATSRDCFRAGILLAVRNAPSIDGLVVGLEALL